MSGDGVRRPSEISLVIFAGVLLIISRSSVTRRRTIGVAVWDCQAAVFVSVPLLKNDRALVWSLALHKHFRLRANGLKFTVVGQHLECPFGTLNRESELFVAKELFGHALKPAEGSAEPVGYARPSGQDQNAPAGHVCPGNATAGASLE